METSKTNEAAELKEVDETPVDNATPCNDNGEQNDIKKSENAKGEEEEELPLEEQIIYYEDLKKKFNENCDFRMVKLCEENIERCRQQIISDNIDEYIEVFLDSCDRLYQKFTKKIKRIQRKSLEAEINLRKEVSEKFQIMRYIHLALLKQFDDQIFEIYEKQVGNFEDPVYNSQVEKSQKLATIGKYNEASKIMHFAEIEHDKLLGEKEQEIAKLYQARVKPIFDSQEREISQLAQTLKSKTEELKKLKKNDIQQVFKSAKSDLDRLYRKFLGNLNKHFSAGKVNLEKQQKDNFEKVYHRFLYQHGFELPPVEKLKDEELKKREAARRSMNSSKNSNRQPRNEPEEDNEGSVLNDEEQREIVERKTSSAKEEKNEEEELRENEEPFVYGDKPATKKTPPRSPEKNDC